MAKHIGIVACSAEGAALCYRTICLEGKTAMGEHNHPEISMHTHPLASYMQYIEAGDWEGVGGLMLSSVQNLLAAGAEFCICPDNTIHQAFPLIQPVSPLPWLHIAKEVAKEAKKHSYKKLAITGTQFLMEGPVYPGKLQDFDIESMIPDLPERKKINQIIFEELVYGEITQASTDFFVSVIQRLKEEGCDAVVLGCTEIPLLVTAEISPLPILDSTRILARAALKAAVE